MRAAPKILSETDYTNVCNLYNEGLSVPAVSDKLNLSRSTVYGIARRNNILRSISESLANCWKQGRIKNRWTGQYKKSHEYNESFFSTHSKEMAWVLGLIFSDGHVGKNCWHISIAKDICDKTKALIGGGSVSPIKGTWSFRVYNWKMCEYLRDAFHISSNKSKTLKFINLPNNISPHFIRGFWDGDGWIGTIKRNRRGKTNLTFESAITLASGDFLKDLLSFLRGISVVKGGSISYYEKRENALSNTPVWLLRLGQRDTVSLCRWMYSDEDGISNNICGDLNYNKWITYQREHADVYNRLFLQRNMV